MIEKAGYPPKPDKPYKTPACRPNKQFLESQLASSLHKIQGRNDTE